MDITQKSTISRSNKTANQDLEVELGSQNQNSFLGDQQLHSKRGERDDGNVNTLPAEEHPLSQETSQLQSGRDEKALHRDTSVVSNNSNMPSTILQSTQEPLKSQSQSFRLEKTTERSNQPQ